MRAHRALAPLLTTLALGSTLTGCDGSTDEPYAPEQVDRAVLVHFQTCEDVLDSAQSPAMEQVGPYGFDGDYGWELSGPAIPTSAGGDECYIEFGTHAP